MKQLALLIAVLFTLPIACADTTAADKAHQAVTTVIPFTIIANGLQSGMNLDTPSLTTIQDETTWQAFWKKHNTINPPPTSPVVDFAKNMLVAIVDGNEPNSGYALVLDRIEQHTTQDGKTELWVMVTREQPASACLNLGMISQPFVFATLPKTAGEPKLVFATRTYEC